VTLTTFYGVNVTFSSNPTARTDPLAPELPQFFLRKNIRESHFDDMDICDGSRFT
jgi:hypothetical protein